jgi:hypothetical protein
MSTLTEIKAAVEELPAEQKEALLLFLAAQLRAHRARLVKPREFSFEQVTDWIAQDEMDLCQLRMTDRFKAESDE